MGGEVCRSGQVIAHTIDETSADSYLTKVLLMKSFFGIQINECARVGSSKIKC
jgi:hypothetical protein